MRGSTKRSKPELWVVRAGVVPYEEARIAQKRLEAARIREQIPDLLLLLEHPPVYTRGRRATPEELPMGEDWYRMQGIDIRETDRGGRVTYHGPGQLVGYPIVSLRGLRSGAGPGLGDDEPPPIDVVGYVRRLERTIVAALEDWRIRAEVVEGLTGVWTPERRKIGSIGVHVSRGVTTHGFAINVNNDLEPFEWIVPCGIEACQMTSVARELGGEQDPAAFATTAARRFGEIHGLAPIEVEPWELARRVPGLESLTEASAAVP
jgi:lipoyl(octanoyl) transferase